MKTVKIEPAKVYYYEAETPDDQDAFIKHLAVTSKTVWTDLSPLASYIPYRNAEYDYDLGIDKADHVIFQIWTYENTARPVLSFSVDFKAHKESVNHPPLKLRL